MIIITSKKKYEATLDRMCDKAREAGMWMERRATTDLLSELRLDQEFQSLQEEDNHEVDAIVKIQRKMVVHLLGIIIIIIIEKTILGQGKTCTEEYFDRRDLDKP